MFIVEITFNTDADGNPSRDYWRNRCLYGPFNKKERAEKFAQDFLPDDTDIEDAVIIELNRARDFMRL